MLSYALLVSSTFYERYAFLTKPARKDAEIAEGYGRLAAANAKHCEPRQTHWVNRYPSLLQDKSPTR
jgi:hypothetical protein